jgi:hypothetical protein
LVKLSLCSGMNHHDVKTSQWRYSSMHSKPQPYTEMSGQLHTQPDVSPGKKAPISWGRRQSGTQNRSEHVKGKVLPVLD